MIKEEDDAAGDGGDGENEGDKTDEAAAAPAGFPASVLFHPAIILCRRSSYDLILRDLNDVGFLRPRQGWFLRRRRLRFFLYGIFRSRVE